MAGYTGKGVVHYGAMKTAVKDKALLGLRLDEVTKTPDGFTFFVTIHDFVEQLELHPAFKTLKLPAKYSHFKQIHQGIKDLNSPSDHSNDLGHDRYMVIQDLLRIREGEVSESNPLWKKRGMLRQFAADIHKMLQVATSEAENIA